MKSHGDSAVNGRSGAQDARDAEHRFARRVCDALEASTAALPPATLERLAMARKAALRAQRVEASRVPAVDFAFAGRRGGRATGGFGFARAGLVGSTLVLVAACLAGFYQVELQRRIQDLADVDSAVLNDDLPIAEVADHGLNAYLKQNP